ncbi:hypothetical protein D1007_13948 [Hordeum vulgare]|nr:hypothetical protein D1007_13948 [Hordeum vulgare]
MVVEAAEAEAARNRPPPVPQLRNQAEEMAFLVSIVQGMEKNIQEIMQNQKSLERVVETKFHNMDVKVSELTTIVRQLQHEVDSMEIPRSEDEDEDDDDEDESPPPTTTHYITRPSLASRALMSAGLAYSFLTIFLSVVLSFYFWGHIPWG